MQITGDKNSIIINCLRPFLLLLVIFNHCTLDTLGGASLFSDYFQTLLGKTITLSATSCFFLISGFLFFYRTESINKDIIKEKLKKRFYSLFVPYIIWNGLGIIALVGAKALSSNVSSDDLNIVKLLKYFWCNNQWATDHINIFGWSTAMTGPIDLPLWYLRDLIVVTIFSPLIYKLVQNYSRGRLFIVIIGLLFVFNIWIQVPGFSAQAFFFWSIGAYLSITKCSIVPDISKVGIITLSAIAISLAIIVTWLKLNYVSIVLSGILHRMLSLVLVLLYLLLFDRITKSKNMMISIPKILISSSFFVYAVHAFPIINPIMITRKSISFFQGSEIIIIIGYIATPFIVYAISVFVYALLKQLAPRIITVISGGR